MEVLESFNLYPRWERLMNKVFVLGLLLLSSCTQSHVDRSITYFHVNKCYHHVKGDYDFRTVKALEFGFMYRESDDPKWFDDRYMMYADFAGDKEIDCYWKDEQ